MDELARHRLRWCSVIASLLLLMSASPPPGLANPAQAGTSVRPALFGMHDDDPTSWPGTPIGSLRLWDSGTTWRDLEPVPGHFAFARLDAAVATALTHDARVTLVLGQTPAAHVALTARPSGPLEFGGADASRMPDLRPWRRYVRTVAERYAGRIDSLQVWNEANILGFWSGTARQMAQLTHAARTVVDRVNRRQGTRLRLVAPSFVARTNTRPIDRFWRQTVDGRTMNDLVDAVALSLYPAADGGPEESIQRLDRIREVILDRRRVTKPLWNTEINYGLVSGGSADPVLELGEERQAAYVIRTYLLNASAGVRRVFWYGWRQRGNVNTVLSVAGQPTLAGRAVGRTQRWTEGSRLIGCRILGAGSRAGTHVCRLEDRNGVKRVYWHPSRSVRLRLPPGATWRRDIRGARTWVRGHRITVDFRPTLVRFTE